MLYVYTFLLIFIMILPAIVIIPQAFTSLNYFKFPVEEMSTKWFDKFFENEQWIVGLERSLAIAVISAILATALGTMAALAMNKLEFKGKSLFMSIMIAPMVVPVVVYNICSDRTYEQLCRSYLCTYSARYSDGVRDNAFGICKCKREP